MTVQTNQSVAAVLRELADYAEMTGDNPFAVRAYRRAADTLAEWPDDLRALAQAGRLREIPGVGQAIDQKVTQFLQTGHIDALDRLRDEIPPGVLTLRRIPDVGPRTAFRLYDELGITSIVEAEQAARSGQIRALKGLGAKSEARILKGIELLNRLSDRVLLAAALPMAQYLRKSLRALPTVVAAETAGSLRRLTPTVGDIDLLAATDKPALVVPAFTQFPEVAEVVSAGEAKATVILHNGLQVDLMALPPAHYGSLLQHFTGSKDHNVALRGRAREQGLSLSERGFAPIESGEPVPCATEEEVYERLGLAWIPPELREDRGEIAAAAQNRLPKLFTGRSIRGDLHVHSSWSDGVNTIEELAQAAIARGYEYIAITDHTKGLGVAGGLDEARFAERQQQIDALNARFAPFRILSGAEVEVRADGSLDLSDEVLAGMDVVVAAVHTGLRGEAERVTARTVQAIRHPHVDVIAHPTGRIIGERAAMELDFDAVLGAAAECGVALEINATPNRLDLDGEHVRRAVERGVRLAIGTDAHRVEGLDAMPFGVAMARRGWATAADVLNTRHADALLAGLSRKEE
ncbi:MAG: DNA polymerase/3'-5' exonuclease PolX [Chloroflexi bacterium]|nr:DNA polymerase/3'-5' exonuclease PolX [Chloroflexota bacterium]MBU1749966.1 DNA polymerase/3'-5' exonuclease PolX [Chloroflexota bacterium]